MRKMALVVLGGLLVAGCGPQKKSSSGNLHIVTVKNTVSARRTLPDTVSYIGTENVRVTGRSEGGTLAGLQGIWLLQAINDTVIAASSSIHPEKVPRHVGEERRDSTTTSEIVDGVVKTTTIVDIRRTSAGSTITPPQGSTYHVPQRPSLSFFGSNETFTGFTGCNKMGGRFSLSGSNNISFKSAAPSTRMACIGDYNETSFIETLQKVNSFKREGEQLLLLQGSKVLLRFSKKPEQ